MGREIRARCSVPSVDVTLSLGQSVGSRKLAEEIQAAQQTIWEGVGFNYRAGESDRRV